MSLGQLRISRRSIGIVAALAGTVSLAIGAHAALSMRALDAAKAVATEQATESVRKGSRIALVIDKLLKKASNDMLSSHSTKRCSSPPKE